MHLRPCGQVPSAKALHSGLILPVRLTGPSDLPFVLWSSKRSFNSHQSSKAFMWTSLRTCSTCSSVLGLGVTGFGSLSLIIENVYQVFGSFGFASCCAAFRVTHLGKWTDLELGAAILAQTSKIATPSCCCFSFLSFFLLLLSLFFFLGFSESFVSCGAGLAVLPFECRNLHSFPYVQLPLWKFLHTGWW